MWKHLETTWNEQALLHLQPAPGLRVSLFRLRFRHPPPREKSRQQQVHRLRRANNWDRRCRVQNDNSHDSWRLLCDLCRAHSYDSAELCRAPSRDNTVVLAASAATQHTHEARLSHCGVPGPAGSGQKHRKRLWRKGSKSKNKKPPNVWANCPDTRSRHCSGATGAFLHGEKP